MEEVVTILLRKDNRIIECKQKPGVYPDCQSGKCEGKAECAAVCPYDVFMIDLLQEDRIGLSFKGRLKGFARLETGPGHEWSGLPHCGECVKYCPEKAITLKRALPA